MKKNYFALFFTILISANLFAQDSYKEVASRIFRSTKLTVTKGNQQKDYHIESPFFNLQLKIYNDSLFVAKLKPSWTTAIKQLSGKTDKNFGDETANCFSVKKNGDENFKIRFNNCDDIPMKINIVIQQDSLKLFQHWSNIDFNNVTINFKDTSSFHQMNMDGFDKTYFFNSRLQMLYSWEFVTVPYFDETQSKLLNRYYEIKKDTAGKILEMNQSKELEWYDYIGTKKISMSKSVKEGEQYKLDAADKTRYYLEIWRDDKKVK